MRQVSFAASLVFLFLIACPNLSQAQIRPTELTRDTRPRNCSISGRVTINGQPAANIQVDINEIPTDFNSPQPIRQTADGAITRSAFKVRTDGEGQYQIASLPPGRFVVTAGSKAFVPPGQQHYDPKLITLDSGESRDNLDFALVRGGVITGQITDAEGRPIIAHQVRVTLIVTGPDGQQQSRNLPGNWGEQMTDDRGVYRIYGLPAGTYLLGAGGDDNFFSSAKYPPIFYPDATTAEQAKLIPVKAGEEVTGINFRLDAKRKTYEAIGRVIEADTGKPVANIRVSCRKTSEEDNEGGYGEGQSDRQGNFRLAGLKQGQYACNLYAGWMESSDFYAEPMNFQVLDEDVSGVEIKALRGGTVSGVAVIEGSNDAAIKAKLARMMIFAHTEPEEPQDRQPQPSSHHQTTIKPDGTFLLTGVAPGNVRLHVNNGEDRTLSFIRMERGGAPVEESFKLSKGEKVNDLRLVFTVGTGVIRGQIQATGQPQAVAGTYRIQARLQGNTTGTWFHNVVDDKGRFELTSLPAGEYELQLFGSSQMPNGDRQMRLLAKQKVFVSPGSTVTMTIPYDPNRPFQEER